MLDRVLLFEGQSPEDPSFGYSDENPIITGSITESETYLCNLRTLNDDRLTWIEEGTVLKEKLHGSDDVLVHMCDLYLNGNKFKTLFICPYGHSSSHVPDGLKLRSEKENAGTKPILFCRECGVKLLGNSSFCQKCGTKIIVPEETK